VLTLVEEGIESRWHLSFGTVQAARFTAEECSASLLGSLPSKGGFLEVKDSPWLKELGQGRISFLEKAQHFIVCCYEEVVEVVATEPRFVPLESSENLALERAELSHRSLAYVLLLALVIFGNAPGRWWNGICAPGSASLPRHPHSLPSTTGTLARAQPGQPLRSRWSEPGGAQARGPLAPAAKRGRQA
jgi:hypothetical protein